MVKDIYHPAEIREDIEKKFYSAKIGKIVTLAKNGKYDEALEHYRFMSANKLINFSDLSVAKKMALLNLEANKFEESVAFINSLKEKTRTLITKEKTSNKHFSFYPTKTH